MSWKKYRKNLNIFSNICRKYSITKLRFSLCNIVDDLQPPQTQLIKKYPSVMLNLSFKAK